MIQVIALFLRAIGFYVLPMVIGRGLMVVGNRKTKFVAAPEVSILRLAVYFAVGQLVLFLLALLCSLTTFGQYFPIALIGLCLVSIGLNFLQIPNFKAFLNRRSFQITFGILFFASLCYAVWLWRSPLPLNWDIYEHQTLSNIIQSGSFNFLTSRLSDTFGFNSYPPSFHLLLAITQYGLTSAKELALYWQVISFVHLILVGYASFAFGYTITRNRATAGLSAMLGILTFDGVIAFTNLFLLPQTLTAVLFILLLSYFFAAAHHRQHVSSLATLACAIMLVLNHYIVGSAATVILLAAFCFYRFPVTIEKILHRVPVVELILLTAVAGAIGSQFINLNSLNRGEASSYIFSLWEKLEFAKRTYGYSLFLFAPLGMYVAIKKLDTQKAWLLLLSIGFGAILLSNFPYALKFYVLARFCFVLLMAMGLNSICEKLQFRLLRWLGYAAVATTFLIILIINLNFWKTGLYDGNNFSHVNNDDLAAANFLSQQYSNLNTLLISDPSTQYILEAFSGVNSAGGVFASPATRQSLNQAFTSSSPNETKMQLLEIRDQVTSTPTQSLFVVSGRFFQWQSLTEAQRKSFDFNVWSPQVLTPNQKLYVQYLVNSSTFQVVYENPSIVILKLN